MQLKDYIQGKRRGNEANLLEREAMNDPFLQEALDGFHTCEGNHAEIIERLEKRFSTPAVAPPKRRNLILYWSAAASILLLIGLTFFWGERDIILNQPEIVFHESRTSEREAASDSPQFEPTEEAEREMSDAKATQKTMSAPEKPSPTIIVHESRSLADAMVVADAECLSEQPEALLAMESAKEQTIMAQDKKQEQATIRGRIVDETGDPLIGVSIVEKGTTNGTTTDVDGNFTFSPAGDSSKLIASYLGYESQEISTSNKTQTLTLRPINLALSEVVVVGGYSVQKKSSMTSAVSTIQSPFGEKEFQTWCQQKADKTVCEGKGATVKVSFVVDETGQPSEIEYKNYSCEEAKQIIENLLASSPVWTKTGKRVTMTIRW